MAQNEDLNCVKIEDNKSTQEHISPTRHPRPSMGNETQSLSTTTTTTAQAVFTIATPAVTTILPITENLNDISFMMSTPSYESQGGSILERQSFCIQEDKEKQGAVSLNQHTRDVSNGVAHQNTQRTQHNFTDSDKNNEKIPTDMNTCHQTNESFTTKPDRESGLESQQNTLTNLNDQDTSTTEINESERKQTTNGSGLDSAVQGKRRNKTSKKNTKLDPKSKLEKSRQSARECRARKKLRYQYLEDLVCNREKAVVKLREELSMFCEISKQVEGGTISEKDRSLLVNQSKENNSSLE